jgi:hypothetical protein
MCQRAMCAICQPHLKVKFHQHPARGHQAAGPTRSASDSTERPHPASKVDGRSHPSWDLLGHTLQLMPSSTAGGRGKATYMVCNWTVMLSKCCQAWQGHAYVRCSPEVALVHCFRPAGCNQNTLLSAAASDLLSPRPFVCAPANHGLLAAPPAWHCTRHSSGQAAPRRGPRCLHASAAH